MAHILFIEDDLEDDPEESTTFLLLHEKGYMVTPARTGKEAIDKLHSTAFDLILLDIMLPPGLLEEDDETNLSEVKRLDMGLHMLNLLRSGAFEPTGTSADVPVVVVSAVPGVDRWDKIRELTGNERRCLSKPCEPEEIIETVAEALL